jgi:hypothetical protein
MFGSELVQRLAIYAALGGTIFSAGIGFGLNHANKDHARKLSNAMAEREKQVIYIDKIVTEYVEKVTTREVPVYVANDNDCSTVSGAFRMFHDSFAADQRLPETTSPADEAPAEFETVANTIAGNYSICHATADQLEALQKWAREVSK